ncbi:651_t:CDS:2 [Ambispora leptoticha]|uniref:651_t:CDS:1 n=1 Tax=Ambispora leptoticha TaxID=144679 RepID=A0A9N9D5M5_9GLOM|nr:651_t:CDS:2 [Ambispora leptoticha]
MFNWIVNRPNRVIELQKYYQQPGPVFLKGSLRKPIIVAYSIMLSGTFLGALYGTVRMAQGKK